MHAHPHTRNPRLLLVTRTLDVGGTERHLAQIAPGLARRGFDVTLYCMAKEGAQVAEVGAAGVKVSGPVPGNGLLPRLGHAATLASGALGLIPEMLLGRPDIAHFFLPHAFIAGSIAAALMQVPVRIMSRRSQNLYQLKHPHIAQLERRLNRTMTAVLGNSAQVASELLGEVGITPDRTGIIHNGIDLARFAVPVDRSAIRASLGLSPSATVFVCLANLITYKGHSDLLQALARIKHQLPADWHLLALGRDGGALASLEAETDALGLGGHVSWLGLRRDVADLLKASDIGVLPSHQEGFSNAVIESMAAGLPMVATDVGGNGEAVRHGETGLLTPAHDPAGLGEALMRVASDPALAARMGTAGKRRARAEFSLDACLDKYEATYRSLLAGNGLPGHIRAGARELPVLPGKAMGGSLGSAGVPGWRPAREATTAAFAEPF